MMTETVVTVTQSQAVPPNAANQAQAKPENNLNWIKFNIRYFQSIPGILKLVQLVSFPLFRRQVILIFWAIWKLLTHVDKISCVSQMTMIESMSSTVEGKNLSNRQHYFGLIDTIARSNICDIIETMIKKNMSRQTEWAHNLHTFVYLHLDMRPNDCSVSLHTYIASAVTKVWNNHACVKIFCASQWNAEHAYNPTRLLA